MCTVFTHAFVALAAGKAAFPEEVPRRFWLLAPICSAAPDLDYGLHAYGVEYHDLWGHRGMAHSIAFAALIALIVVPVFFFRVVPAGSRRWWALLAFFFLITASHGFLDAFTDGGLGIAFFAPFDNERHFIKQVLPVPDLGLSSVFRMRFVEVMWGEVLMVWLPVTIASGVVWVTRRVVRRRPEVTT